MKLISAISLMMIGLVVACGGSTPTQSSGGTGGTGGSSVQECTKGTECPTQCCWAFFCAGEEDKNICADHGVTPDQCGKCVND